MTLLMVVFLAFSLSLLVHYAHITTLELKALNSGSKPDIDDMQRPVLPLSILFILLSIGTEFVIGIIRPEASLQIVIGLLVLLNVVFGLRAFIVYKAFKRAKS